MSRQRLSSGVRQTLNSPRQGAAQISPRCSLARPGRNYSSSSSVLLTGQSGARFDSPHSARHHPPRIARPRHLVRLQSSNAATAPSSSVFPSPFEPQTTPAIGGLSQDDYVARSLAVNPGASYRRPYRDKLDRPPTDKPDYFHRRSMHPTAPATDQETAEYFRALFPPLHFSEDLAVRLVTHTSWMGGYQGHNSRFLFLGRRFLRANMFMFLQSAEVHTPKTKYDVPPWDDEVAAGSGTALETHTLGKEVGRVWGLERVMRWVPVMPDSTKTERVLMSSGLWKVRGATVEAVIGGILHQHGGLVAHRAFQTRVLPHIAHYLPPMYRDAAKRLTQKMGGEHAPLTIIPATQCTQQEDQEAKRNSEREGAADPTTSDSIAAQAARHEFQRDQHQTAVAPPSHNKVPLMG